MEHDKVQIEIKKYLPHLKPMLLVDAIEHICTEEVLTYFRVTNDCIFVTENGLSETGLIENAAQTCSAISGQHYFNEEPSAEAQNNPNVIGFISSIKKITIHQLPQIQTLIQTKAQLISHVQTPEYSICTLKVVTYHADTLFLEGEMNLFLQKK